MRRVARGSAGSPRCRRRRASGRPSARRPGEVARPARTASSPSAASPTTSRSGSVSRIIRKPRAHQRLVVGDEHPDASGRRSRRAPAAASATQLEPAAVARLRPTATRRTRRRARACRAGRCRRRRAGSASGRAVVADRELERSRRSYVDRRPRHGAGRAGVPQGVGQRPPGRSRYAVRSRPGAQRRRSPVDRSVDGQPGAPELARPAGRAGPAPGGGSQVGAPAVACAQHTDHPAHLGQGLPARPPRPSRAPPARPPGPARQPAPTAEACTVMTLTLCPTTSCSSRAIRLRSSATARAACCSRVAARCSAFSRVAAHQRADAARRSPRARARRRRAATRGPTVDHRVEGHPARAEDERRGRGPTTPGAAAPSGRRSTPRSSAAAATPEPLRRPDGGELHEVDRDHRGQARQSARTPPDHAAAAAPAVAPAPRPSAAPAGGWRGPGPRLELAEHAASTARSRCRMPGSGGSRQHGTAAAAYARRPRGGSARPAAGRPRHRLGARRRGGAPFLASSRLPNGSHSPLEDR